MAVRYVKVQIVRTIIEEAFMREDQTDLDIMTTNKFNIERRDLSLDSEDAYIFTDSAHPQDVVGTIRHSDVKKVNETVAVTIE